MSAVKMGRERTQSEKKVDPDEVDEDLPEIPMMRILKRNSPEYIYIFIGVLASSLMVSKTGMEWNDLYFSVCFNNKYKHCTRKII